ncbi:hypothetical protein MKX03_021521 [Papaver bracteatum]|nr:hypothetical protein MKX03_021521 [Papaver bracteatum]
MTLRFQQQQQPLFQQQQKQVHVVGASSAEFNSGSPLKSLPSSPQHSHHSSIPVELEEPYPLPLGCQRFLDLKSGEIYYKKEGQEKRLLNRESRRMSRHGKGPRLDLKLNLSPPRVNNITNPRQVESPNHNRRSGNSSPTSPPSSCVSSENSNDDTLRYSSSPEATSMVLVGCPRCLMYVMLSEEDPKCPKCKSTVLLDFLHDNTTKKTRNFNNNNN